MITDETIEEVYGRLDELEESLNEDVSDLATRHDGDIDELSDTVATLTKEVQRLTRQVTHLSTRLLEHIEECDDDCFDGEPREDCA